MSTIQAKHDSATQTYLVTNGAEQIASLPAAFLRTAAAFEGLEPTAIKEKLAVAFDQARGNKAAAFVALGFWSNTEPQITVDEVRDPDPAAESSIVAHQIILRNPEGPGTLCLLEEILAGAEEQQLAHAVQDHSAKLRIPAVF